MFLDDVLVYSQSDESRFAHLRATFQLLKGANLKLKPKKCRLVQRQVTYLSHIIGSEGIKANPQKVEAVTNGPVPSTVKGVRSFLGFCNYYCRFVRDFAGIARPIFVDRQVPGSLCTSQERAYHCPRIGVSRLQRQLHSRYRRE